MLRHAADDWVIACPPELLEQVDKALSDRLTLAGSMKYVQIEAWTSFDLTSTLGMWNEALGIARESMCGRIFFSEIDTSIKFSVFLPKSSVPVSGVLFRPIPHYPDLSFRERVISFGQTIALRHFLNSGPNRSVLTLDQAFARWADDNPAFRGKVHYVPDLQPMQTKDRSRLKESGFSPRMSQKMTFLTFGALQKRKGIFELIEAIDLLPREIAIEASFYIWGKIYPDAAGFAELVEAVSNRSAAEINFVDGFIPKEEIERLVHSADVIIAPYLRHRGSSGLLYWAAANRKPVLAQRFGQVGREVEQFKLGMTIEVMTPASLTRTLQDVICERAVPFSQEGQDRFINGHEEVDLCQAIELCTAVA
jgi:glycosyltransferase involved in cell wall biosynthesis